MRLHLYTVKVYFAILHIGLRKPDNDAWLMTKCNRMNQTFLCCSQDFYSANLVNMLWETGVNSKIPRIECTHIVFTCEQIDLYKNF